MIKVERQSQYKLEMTLNDAEYYWLLKVARKRSQLEMFGVSDNEAVFWDHLERALEEGDL